MLHCSGGMPSSVINTTSSTERLARSCRHLDSRSVCDIRESADKSLNSVSLQALRVTFQSVFRKIQAVAAVRRVHCLSFLQQLYFCKTTVKRSEAKRILFEDLEKHLTRI